MKVWTGTKANSETVAIKIREGGTEAQELETAKALRSAGFVIVADEHGRHILCEH